MHVHNKGLSAGAVLGPVAAQDTLFFTVEAFLTLQNSPDYADVFCCLDSPLDQDKWDLQQLKPLLAHSQLIVF